MVPPPDSYTRRSLSVEDLPQVFGDVTPVPQADSDGVARIDYPPHFATIYDYWRAVRGTEHSARVRDLTELCLEYNPANYTVWQDRRLCIEAEWNVADVDEELALAAKLGGSNPKNYQIWHHRRAVLEKLLDRKEQLEEYGNRELSYIASVLQVDGKNYHAWSQRQWVLRTALPDPWDAEIQFAHSLIEADIRNNSAWNDLWFASHRGEKDAMPMEEARIHVEYALQQARLDPYNESPLRFLVALVKEQGTELLSDDALVAMDEQVVVPNELGPSSALLAARVDLLEFQQTEEAHSRALEVARRLVEVDPIRRNYWNMRVSKLEAA